MDIRERFDTYRRLNDRSLRHQRGMSRPIRGRRFRALIAKDTRYWRLVGLVEAAARAAGWDPNP